MKFEKPMHSLTLLTPSLILNVGTDVSCCLVDNTARVSNLRQVAPFFSRWYLLTIIAAQVPTVITDYH